MSTEDNLHHIFMSIRKTMTRIVSRIVPPREIEDIVQETYVRICQIEQKENIKQPHSFLLRTARNLAIDYIKRAEVRLVDSVETFEEFELFPAEKDEIYNQVANDEEFSQYCEAIRHLPLQCRKVFVLKKVYGHSQKEIARQLDLSESTVEKHVALGVKRCTYYMMQIRDKDEEKMKNYPIPLQQGGYTNE